MSIPSFAYRWLMKAVAQEHCVMILTYHRVLAAPDTMLSDEPDAVTFDRTVAALAASTNLITLDEAARGLADRTLPARAVVLTFDDGYANNHDVALPILQRYDARATFFVSSGYLQGDNLWNDIVIETIRHAPAGNVDLGWLGLGKDLVLEPAEDRMPLVLRILNHIKHWDPSERLAAVTRLKDTLGGPDLPPLMMSEAQVAALASAGMEIGGHTVSHPILSRLDDGAAAREISVNRDDLRAITGASPTSFAYPNGRLGDDFDERHMRMAAEAGYGVAVSTDYGIAGPRSHTFRLPRLGVWDKSALRIQARLLRLWRVDEAA